MAHAAELTHARLVADELFQVRLPLPFALNHVNAYMLREPDGWTILDAGLHRPEICDLWEAAWQELGIAPSSVRRIVLTHMHPDHFGASGWLQQRTGAAVFMSPREREVAMQTWIEDLTEERRAAVAEYERRAGVHGEVATIIERQQDYLRSLTFPHPAELLILAPGETVALGGRHFRTIHAPGHADGQILFYDEANRLMLCGDQVLQRITPNIGFWPSTEPDPLGRYLASLAELSALTVDVALPGHHGVIHNWAERLAQLQVHHANRLEAMEAAAGEGATALEVSYAVFNYDRFSMHEVRFAVAEALAHLEHLVVLGRLERVEGAESRIYRSSEPRT
ncbi:MAG: MBL fold metallo-hydrolase [Anaerolineales bacterium]|nr:MBL fold metallo-hydrolase [Anaerolineales bacterium]